MKKIQAGIASKNPSKVNAVANTLEALGYTCDLISAETASGVSDQPRSLAETRLGAVNRAKAMSDQSVDIAIGLEGGVYELDGEMYVCNWGALATNNGKVYTAAGAQLPLPEEIAVKLRAGGELGPIMDTYANESGIRHHKGAVGVLTAGLIKRDEMFGHIVKILLGQYARDID